MLQLKQTFSLQTSFLFFLLVLVFSFLLAYCVIYLTDNIYIVTALFVFGFLFLFSFVWYFVDKRNKQILSDAKELTQYLEEINAKNYDAVIKTKYFSEFLQIELLLKNLVKRLHKKQRKK